MLGLPQELAFFLVFGAVLLIRFLYRSLRRQAESMQAQAEPEVRAEPAPSKAPAAAAVAREVAPPRSSPQAPAKPVAPRAPQRVRRYTRTELMPDRRAVQDAIVISAILQPCHAQRARDVD